MIKFLKSAFSDNCGYTLIKQYYQYNDEQCIDYILCRNYTIFWLPGNKLVDVFSTEQELNKYLEENSITL